MILLLWLACIPKLKVADRVGWEPAGETLVFQDVSVFPATGPELLTHQDVLVAGGRIARVAPTGEAPPPAARVIPGAGRTLLPGLIDMLKTGLALWGGWTAIQLCCGAGLGVRGALELRRRWA